MNMDHQENYLLDLEKCSLTICPDRIVIRVNGVEEHVSIIGIDKTLLLEQRDGEYTIVLITKTHGVYHFPLTSSLIDIKIRTTFLPFFNYRGSEHTGVMTLIVELTKKICDACCIQRYPSFETKRFVVKDGLLFVLDERLLFLSPVVQFLKSARLGHLKIVENDYTVYLRDGDEIKFTFEESRGDMLHRSLKEMHIDVDLEHCLGKVGIEFLYQNSDEWTAKREFTLKINLKDLVLIDRHHVMQIPHRKAKVLMTRDSLMSDAYDSHFLLKINSKVKYQGETVKYLKFSLNRGRDSQLMHFDRSRSWQQWKVSKPLHLLGLFHKLQCEVDYQIFPTTKYKDIESQSIGEFFVTSRGIHFVTPSRMEFHAGHGLRLGIRTNGVLDLVTPTGNFSFQSDNRPAMIFLVQNWKTFSDKRSTMKIDLSSKEGPVWSDIQKDFDRLPESVPQNVRDRILETRGMAPEMLFATGTSNASGTSGTSEMSDTPDMPRTIFRPQRIGDGFLDQINEGGSNRNQQQSLINDNLRAATISRLRRRQSPSHGDNNNRATATSESRRRKHPSHDNQRVATTLSATTTNKSQRQSQSNDTNESQRHSQPRQPTSRNDNLRATTPTSRNDTLSHDNQQVATTITEQQQSQTHDNQQVAMTTNGNLRATTPTSRNDDNMN